MKSSDGARCGPRAFLRITFLSVFTCWITELSVSEAADSFTQGWPGVGGGANGTWRRPAALSSRTSHLACKCPAGFYTSGSITIMAPTDMCNSSSATWAGRPGPTSFRVNMSTCHGCAPGCQVCTGPEEHECSRCAAGFFVNYHHEIIQAQTNEYSVPWSRSARSLRGTVKRKVRSAPSSGHPLIFTTSTTTTSNPDSSAWLTTKTMKEEELLPQTGYEWEKVDSFRRSMKNMATRSMVETTREGEESSGFVTDSGALISIDGDVVSSIVDNAKGDVNRNQEEDATFESEKDVDVVADEAVQSDADVSAIVGQADTRDSDKYDAANRPITANSNVSIIASANDDVKTGREKRKDAGTFEQQDAVPDITEELKEESINEDSKRKDAPQNQDYGQEDFGQIAEAEPQTTRIYMKSTKFDINQSGGGVVGGATSHAASVTEPEDVTAPNQPPEIDSLRGDSPEIESPEVDSPEVNSPEVDSPEVDSPEVFSPEVDSVVTGKTVGGGGSDGSAHTVDPATDSEPDLPLPAVWAFSCVARCPHGFYANSRRICRPCDRECDGCYGDGPERCIGCRHFKMASRCVWSCGVGGDGGGGGEGGGCGVDRDATNGTDGPRIGASGEGDVQEGTTPAVYYAVPPLVIAVVALCLFVSYYRHRQKLRRSILWNPEKMSKREHCGSDTKAYYASYLRGDKIGLAEFKNSSETNKRAGNAYVYADRPLLHQKQEQGGCIKSQSWSSVHDENDPLYETPENTWRMAPGQSRTTPRYTNGSASKTDQSYLVPFPTDKAVSKSLDDCRTHSTKLSASALKLQEFRRASEDASFQNLGSQYLEIPFFEAPPLPVRNTPTVDIDDDEDHIYANIDEDN